VKKEVIVRVQNGAFKRSRLYLLVLDCWCRFKGCVAFLMMVEVYAEKTAPQNSCRPMELFLGFVMDFTLLAHGFVFRVLE
jgi:hypothetical protein